KRGRGLQPVGSQGVAYSTGGFGSTGYRREHSNTKAAKGEGRAVPLPPKLRRRSRLN
ncbi:hypothetical protein A2U01_0031628, partial [Trifolium medium]|nr:hypothetical protein [Trifolium medium]